MTQIRWYVGVDHALSCAMIVDEALARFLHIYGEGTLYTGRSIRRNVGRPADETALIFEVLVPGPYWEPERETARLMAEYLNELCGRADVRYTATVIHEGGDSYAP